MGLPFQLDIRPDPDTGENKLYVSARFMSDFHWGTRQCRAKLICHVFERIDQARLYLIGDMIDGEHLLKKWRWNFPPAHLEGMAHALRHRAHYIPGNHDEAIREQVMTYRGRGDKFAAESKIELVPGQDYLHHNLCGKEICGVRVDEHTIHHGLNGERLLVIHSDKYDYQLLGSRRNYAYAVGDFFNSLLVTLDIGVEYFWPKFSLAAFLKRKTKHIINGAMGVNSVIAKAVDDNPDIQGVVFGHSHMPGISHTPAGKYLLNDGSGTEYVQALEIDKNGTKAVVEYRKDCIIISDEHGHVQRHTWGELGMKPYGEVPLVTYDDVHKANAQRLVRLVYRKWPPRTRRVYGAFMKAKHELGLGRSQPFAGHIPMPKVQRPIQGNPQAGFEPALKAA